VFKGVRGVETFKKLTQCMGCYHYILWSALKNDNPRAYWLGVKIYGGNTKKLKQCRPQYVVVEVEMDKIIKLTTGGEMRWTRRLVYGGLVVESVYKNVALRLVGDTLIARGADEETKRYECDGDSLRSVIDTTDYGSNINYATRDTLVELGLEGETCKCGAETAKKHPCPYAEEINGDDTPCTCCDECAHECAMDI
jgi:hypothetical protein